MKVVVLQVKGIDDIQPGPTTRLEALTKPHFVQAVKEVGIDITEAGVHVSILEGPRQRVGNVAETPTVPQTSTPVVLQVSGVDNLSEEQTGKLQEQTRQHFLNAAKDVGLNLSQENVRVDILQPPPDDGARE